MSENINHTLNLKSHYKTTVIRSAPDSPLFGHLIGCDVASHDRWIQEVFWFHKAEAYNLLKLNVF